jgi:hypothetical protein
MMEYAGRSSARRLGWLSVAVLFMVGVAISAHAQSASATSLLACAGTEHESFSPGITNEPREIEVTTEYNYSSCINDENLFEGRTGSGTRKIVKELSCENVSTFLKGERTIDWSNGKSSVLDLTEILTDGLAVGQLEGVGTVASGEFEKDTATDTLTFLDIDLADACTEPGGIKEIDGLATLEITL